MSCDVCGGAVGVHVLRVVFFNFRDWLSIVCVNCREWARGIFIRDPLMKW